MALLFSWLMQQLASWRVSGIIIMVAPGAPRDAVNLGFHFVFKFVVVVLGSTPSLLRVIPGPALKDYSWWYHAGYWGLKLD